MSLLAQEAPKTAFEGLLRTARSQGADPERLAALEQAVQLASAVQASAEERRRREAAMAALVDTARDIASPSDLDGLLNVITGRARRLLGFDMAYISLRKPEGGSYVHSSQGETTVFNVGLRIDEGHGLGEVAQDRRAPFWTADYLNDSAFPHSDRIDDVVRAEGLRAIIAVPMSLGSTTVGALYGADRNLRHFTPDEVSLLRSLADLAAVALEKARLLDRIQSEAARLEQENVRERARTGSLLALSAARDRLAALALDGADMAEVAKATADALGGTVAVHDSLGQCLAATGELDRPDEPAVLKAALSALAARTPVPVTGSGPGALWATPALAGSQELGILLLQCAEPLTPEQAGFLDFAGRAVALMLLLQRSAAVAAGPVRDELFDDLLAGAPHARRKLAERARRLGIDPARPYTVLAVRPDGSELGQAVVWASSYAYRTGGLKTVHDGCIVLLLPEENASRAAENAHREISALLGKPVSVGAAGPARELAAVPEVHQEARRCLDAVIAVGGAGSAAATEELGFLGMLLAEDLDVDRYIESTLGPVLAYDRQREAELVRTLGAYFASQGSPTRAANILSLHANTVSRRLERLTELLGPHWQDPSSALELQLALRLYQTRQLLRRKPAPDRRPEPPAAAED
ncbi:GAF domain-containing protein [Streptomyces sp. NPDC089919]|uniref:helix-turn-helix domain-containing protein n=1 Tax=Streptomyces sp. NPDC089919 TaxID=3155188 RepID=UPI003422C9F9